MDSPLISSASARHISVDWSLIAMTAVALALLVVTTVRTGTAPEPGTPFRSGGLEVLDTHETLVAFEDFSFGAQGWTTTAAQTGYGTRGVFGPFGMGAVAKRFDLPSDTSQVRVAFDLHLSDDIGSEGFSVRVNGEPVIEGATPLGSSNAVIRQRGAEGDYAVWILLDQPGDALSLEVEAIPGPDAAWTIDNVSVVALAGTS
jgi:hypothetical protein